MQITKNRLDGVAGLLKTQLKILLDSYDLDYDNPTTSVMTHSDFSLFYSLRKSIQLLDEIKKELE